MLKISNIDTGSKYGRFTVLKESERNNGRRYFLCKCQCGNIKNIQRSHLVLGHTKSCGCLQKEKAIENGKKVVHIMIESLYTHGMSYTRFYKIYTCIKARCNNPKTTDYKYWGGKGIQCEWETFEEFKNDMYESYLKHCEEFGERDTSIDRINGNGNYCKKNCRWATPKEQANNRNSKIN